MSTSDLTLCTGCEKVRVSSPDGICASCSNKGVMTTEIKQSEIAAQIRSRLSHIFPSDPCIDVGVASMYSLVTDEVLSALEELEKEFDVLRPQDNVTFTREFALSAIKTLEEKYR